MSKKKSDVLMLLKCNGLQFDDRVRKECGSIFKVSGLNSEIHVVENDNKDAYGAIFETNTVFKSYHLITRKLFKGNRLLFIKLLEFFFKVMPSTLTRRKAVWLHDPLMFVFVPYFSFLKKIGIIELLIWDQHELPPSYFLKNKLLKFFYKSAMGMVDVRIHANKQRADYLNELLNENYSYMVLNNYVDNIFSLEPAKPLSSDAMTWLNGEQFLLLQSGAYYERNFSSVVEAVCSYSSLKCIVVGGSDVDLSEYQAKYKNFDELFFFVGMVPQIRLVDFIDQAKASLILYKDSIPNSYFCEPNRLYQASCRGTFVIVGSNPPMKDFVELNNNGIVLKSDGQKAQDIIQALEYISENELRKNKVASDWSVQELVFSNVFSGGK
tara:strand:- start:6922 stop:8064 length:1143 start_codon:yes stop_codon:yes gene_type:complete